MAQFIKMPILFRNTPVSARTWFWFLGPTYGTLNLFTLWAGPSSDFNFLSYVFMSIGAAIGLWAYAKLGLKSQPKNHMKDWETPMLGMWFAGATVLAIAVIGIPTLLLGSGVTKETTIQILSTTVLPFALGFLMVSAFAILIYAALYQILVQLYYLIKKYRQSK